MRNTSVLLLISYFLVALPAQADHDGLWHEPSGQPPIQLYDQRQPYQGYSGPAYEQPMQRAYERQLQQQRQLDALESQIRREQQGRRSYTGESLLAPQYPRGTRGGSLLKGQ